MEMMYGQRVMVKVIPRASKDEVVGMQGETLKVRLRAPPVDGAANGALCGLLADYYGVKPSAVRIVRGQTSRLKMVEIR